MKIIKTDAQTGAPIPGTVFSGEVRDRQLFHLRHHWRGRLRHTLIYPR